MLRKPDARAHVLYRWDSGSKSKAARGAWTFRRAALCGLLLAVLVLGWLGYTRLGDPLPKGSARSWSGYWPSGTGTPVASAAFGFGVPDARQSRALVDLVRQGLLPLRGFHVHTDKPWYRLTEPVFVRVVAVDSGSHALAESPLTGVLSLVSPSGAVAASAPAALVDGAFFGKLTLPAGLAGGSYVVRFAHEDRVAERNVTLAAFRPSAMKLELALGSEGGEGGRAAGYGPGDRVRATLRARTAEGGSMPGARVTVEARVDGTLVHSADAQLSRSVPSPWAFDFALPSTLPAGRGDASLAVTVAFAGRVETVVRTLPLALSPALNVTVYPAGGFVVAAVPNELFFESRTRTDEPLAFVAKLCSILATGDELCEPARIEATHEGRGSFVFTPPTGARRSFLRVLAPAGITEPIELPDPLPTGVSLLLAEPVLDAGAPVRALLHVRAPHAVGSQLVLVASRNERQLTNVSVTLTAATAAGEPLALALQLPADVFGVVRLTVLASSADGTALGLAERLVFVRPDDEVRWSLVTECAGRADGSPCAPRDEVLVRVTATSARTGEPVRNALLGVRVSDDATAARVESRRRAPLLDASVLLEPEVAVGALTDAAAYLDPTPAGARALALLLGTQGWRRFAWLDLVRFLENAPLAAATRAVGGLPSNWRDWLPQPVDAQSIHRVGRWARRAEPAAFEMMAGAAPMMAKAARGNGEGIAEFAMADVASAEGEVEDVTADAGAGFGERADGNAVADAGAGADVDADVADSRGEPPMGAARRDDARRGRPAARPQAVEPMSGLIRQYAHQRRGQADDATRADFTDTVLAALVTRTDESGSAAFRFVLSDAVTSYRVVAELLGRAPEAQRASSPRAGRHAAIGAAEREFAALLPLALTLKAPPSAVAGDLIELPLVITSGLGAHALGGPVVLEEVALTGGCTLEASAPAVGSTVALVDGAVRLRLPLRVVQNPSEFGSSARVRVRVRAGAYVDEVSATIELAARGFPQRVSTGGLLRPDASARAEFMVADTMQAGSLNVTLELYPSPMASLTRALRALLREPCGCFEQTSSTTYPLVMALQYMRTHAGVPDEMRASAEALLERGYQRLRSYEVPGGGFEWFGASPAHEALTGYGLAQFVDMAAVREVDPALVQRANEWLLSRGDPALGVFKRNPLALDSFGAAPETITNAYVLYALTSAGVGGPAVERYVTALERAAGESADSYLLGLAAGVLYNVGRADAARGLSQRVVAAQDPATGVVRQSATSITCSAGLALDVETTSIAVLGWLRSGDSAFTQPVEAAMRWLASACEDGRFGSTQGTVLALKAIIAYDASRTSARAPGVVRVSWDGEPTVTLELAPEAHAAIALPVPASVLKRPPGKRALTLELERGYVVPFAVSATYSVVTPPSSLGAGLELSTELAHPPAAGPQTAGHAMSAVEGGRSLAEGQLTELRVRVRNLDSELGLPMTVAVVGVPAGLTARVERLDALVRDGTIAFFELVQDEVRLYWRALAPAADVAFSFDVVADVPGDYTGRASRVYRYYADQATVWAQPLGVSVSTRSVRLPQE